MPDSDLPEPDSTHFHDLLDRFLRAHPEGVEADLDGWASGVPELASEPDLVARLRGLLDERRRGEAPVGARRAGGHSGRPSSARAAGSVASCSAASSRASAGSSSEEGHPDRTGHDR
jgi:hypothetical protein